MRADKHSDMARLGQRRRTALPRWSAPVAPRGHVQHFLDSTTHSCDVWNAIGWRILSKRGQRIRSESKLVAQCEVHRGTLRGIETFPRTGRLGEQSVQVIQVAQAFE